MRVNRSGVPLQWRDRMKGYKNAVARGDAAAITEQLAHLERIARKFGSVGLRVPIEGRTESLTKEARLGYVA